MLIAQRCVNQLFQFCMLIAYFIQIVLRLPLLKLISYGQLFFLFSYKFTVLNEKYMLTMWHTRLNMKANSGIIRTRSLEKSTKSKKIQILL